MSSLQVITAPAKEWLAALSRLTPATAGKKVLPILSAVFVDPMAASLRAIGKDVMAETAIETTPGEGEPFLVSCAWLRSAITSTTGRNRNADVHLTANGNQITLETLGYKLTSEGWPIANFPTKDEHHVFASHSALDAAELATGLSRALVAVPSDEYIPALAGVCFEQFDGGVRLFSTDRYRLVSDLVVGPGFGDERYVIPLAVLKLLVKQFKTGTVYVDRAKEDGPVVFRTSSTTYSVTPNDGNYPKIGTLFNTSPTTVVDVDRIQLLEAANVAASMSARNTPAYLAITDSGVQVSFNDGLFGPDIAPLAAGELSGSTVTLALNTHFFLEAMKTFKAEKVRIHGNLPSKAFTLIDGGADVTDATIYRHLIMTVRMPEQDGNRG